MNERRLTLTGAAALWRDLDGETVVLDTASESYLAVNQSGSVLWRMLAAGTTVAQMTDRLIADFDLTPARAATDVRAFVNRCVDLGYVDV